MDVVAKRANTHQFRPLATVWWTDNGTNVVSRKTESDQRVGAATRSTLEKLMAP